MLQSQQCDLSSSATLLLCHKLPLELQSGALKVVSIKAQRLEPTEGGGGGDVHGGL